MNFNQMDFYKAKLHFEIDSWDLYEAVSKGEAVVIVDARSSDAYEQRHIPGALNIPHRTMTRESTAHLDRSKTYVTYCDGIGCNASTKGALKLAELGLTVKELIGGLDWWVRDGYATQGRAATNGRSISCGCE